MKSVYLVFGEKHNVSLTYMLQKEYDVLTSLLQDKSHVPLVAYEKYQQPREVEVSYSTSHCTHFSTYLDND